MKLKILTFVGSSVLLTISTFYQQSNSLSRETNLNTFLFNPLVQKETTYEEGKVSKLIYDENGTKPYCNKIPRSFLTKIDYKNKLKYKFINERSGSASQFRRELLSYGFCQYTANSREFNKLNSINKILVNQYIELIHEYDEANAQVVDSLMGHSSAFDTDYYERVLEETELQKKIILSFKGKYAEKSDSKGEVLRIIKKLKSIALNFASSKESIDGQLNSSIVLKCVQNKGIVDFRYRFNGISDGGIDSSHRRKVAYKRYLNALDSMLTFVASNKMSTTINLKDTLLSYSAFYSIRKELDDSNCKPRREYSLYFNNY